MTTESFVELLGKHAGARKDGGAYAMSAETDVTIYVALEGETLTVARVSRVEVAGSLAILDGPRGERTCVAIEDVRAVRVGRGEALGGGAGFGRT